MRLIINELKKIFKPQSLLIAVLIFLFLCLVFPGTLRESISLTVKFDSENYPEQIPLDVSVYSVELKFNDMLLKKYGNSIDSTELPLVKSQLDAFAEQLKTASQNDKILNRNGIELSDELFFYSIYESQNAHEISEMDQQYIWECSNGVRQLENTDYPIYFAGALKNIVDYMENQSGNGTAVYHVLSNAVVSGIITDLQIILWATVSALFLVVPYMVEENRSKIELFEYTSMVGRKSYFNKIIAIIISLICTIGMGAGCSALIFTKWDLSRYYHSNISTLLYSDKSIGYSDFLRRCYSECSLIQIYCSLLIGLLICGILIVSLSAIVSYRFDNIVSAFAVNLLFMAVPILFFSRYISYGLSLDGGILITKFEPIFVTFLIVAVVTAMILFDAKRKKSVEV